MIIVCQKCSARLQIDDTKVSSRPFNVRCPKCNSDVNSASFSTSPAMAQSAPSGDVVPSPAKSQFKHPKPAPLFELESDAPNAESSSVATEKLIELLSSLINTPATRSVHTQGARPLWNPRRALICLTEDKREQVARGLAETGYQVFVAEDTTQAVERMREHQLDVVIMDPRFDPVEQGAVFVTREVNILRPAQRRRLFFVLLSPTLRTMDAHSAFLNNVNAVVNINDAEQLPALIDLRVRDFNELYKDFNDAMKIQAL